MTMGNIETFPSKHMYLYILLVERKVAEFYHNMVEITYFHRFLRTFDGVLKQLHQLGKSSSRGIAALSFLCFSFFPFERISLTQ